MSFEPNPMFAFGRIDTSAGEGGESLHKVNPNAFGVVQGHIGRGADVDGPGDSEAIELTESVRNEGLSNAEDGQSPSIVVDLGTVDTTGHEGPHTPTDEQVTAASEVALGLAPAEELVDAQEEQPLPQGDVQAGAQTAGGVAEAISTNDEPKGLPEGWSAEPEDGWDSLTGEQLKDELRLRGLPVSGSKAELVERLQNSDKNPLA